MQSWFAWQQFVGPCQKAPPHWLSLPTQFVGAGAAFADEAPGSAIIICYVRAQRRL
jgi:hypothetical protein